MNTSRGSGILSVRSRLTAPKRIARYAARAETISLTEGRANKI